MSTYKVGWIHGFSKNWNNRNLRCSPLWRYGIAVVAVAIALLLSLHLAALLNRTPTPLFFAAVMVSSWYGGMGPAFLSAVLSALAIDYFFLGLPYTLSFAFDDLLLLSVFLLVALLISWLNAARDRAQIKLRQSEERFRLLVEGVEDYAIYMLDPQGYVISWNVGAQRLSGYRAKEILGQHFSRFYTAVDLEQGKPAQLLRSSAAEGRCTEEGWRVRQDGSWFWADVVITALRDETGHLTGFSNITRDRTERKQAEQKLRSSENRFRSLIEQAPIIIQRFAPNGSILETNPAWEKVWCTTQDALDGYNILQDPQVKAFGHLPEIEKAFAGQAVSLPPVFYDPTAMGRRGIPRWIEVFLYPIKDEAGNVLEVVLITQDISDRQQAQEALRLNNERLTLALDAAQMGSWDWDVVTGEITWTPYHEKLFGYEPGKPQRSYKEWSDRIHPEDLSWVEACIQASLKHQQDFRAEYRVVWPDGSLHWVAAFGRFQYDAQHRCLRMVGMVTDITERKLAEAEIRQLNETLEQRVEERTAQLAEANQELEAFAYSIAHDLRAPLRGMQGLSEALLEDYGDRLDELGQEYARQIVASAERLEELIHDLLAYSRLSRTDLTLKAVNLNLVVAEAMRQLETDLKQQQAIVTMESPLPQVLGHHTTLVQVFTNLLSNAIKFVEGVPPHIQILTATDDTCVTIWVVDNGIGIAPEHQTRIFRVFERLHGIEEYPGTGIGLAIVYKGIKRMGGNVGLESQLGHGSRFWVKLRSPVKNE